MMVRRRTVMGGKTDLTKVTIAAVSAQTFTGQGITPTPTVTYKNKNLIQGVDFEYIYSENINVGTATIIVHALPTSKKYKGEKSTTFTINKMSLAIPTCSGSYTYSGSAQSAVISGFDSTWETQGGDVSATNAGSYTVTWDLIDTANTQWSDETVEQKSAGWSIAKASWGIYLDSSSGTVYTYSPRTATVSIDNDPASRTLSISRSNTNATASLSGNIITYGFNSAGTCVITVTAAANNNCNAATATFTVTCTTQYRWGRYNCGRGCQLINSGSGSLTFAENDSITAGSGYSFNSSTGALTLTNTVTQSAYIYYRSASYSSYPYYLTGTSIYIYDKRLYHFTGKSGSITNPTTFTYDVSYWIEEMICKGTFDTYVYSTNRNAYPDDGYMAGYWYVYE